MCSYVPVKETNVIDVYEINGIRTAEMKSNEEWSSQLWTQFMQFRKKPEKWMQKGCSKYGKLPKSCEQLVESPSGRQHTTPALSRKGSIIMFRGSPLHQHTTRRRPHHRMYAHEDFYGGKAHIPTPLGGGGGKGVTPLYKPYRYVGMCCLKG